MKNVRVMNTMGNGRHFLRRRPAILILLVALVVIGLLFMAKAKKMPMKLVKSGGLNVELPEGILSKNELDDKRHIYELAELDSQRRRQQATDAFLFDSGSFCDTTLTPKRIQHRVDDFAARVEDLTGLRRVMS